MTADRPWADLPNARHIDAVLADGRTKKAWDAAWESVWLMHRSNEWDKEWGDASTAAVRAAPSILWRAMWDAVFKLHAGSYDGVRDAIRALIAWDDSADLLDLPPDALCTLMDVAAPPVCHQAALLLPWAIVRETP